MAYIQLFLEVDRGRKGDTITGLVLFWPDEEGVSRAAPLELLRSASENWTAHCAPFLALHCLDLLDCLPDRGQGGASGH
jgi:hypothetical protein